MANYELSKTEWNKLIDEMLEKDKALVGTTFIPGRAGREYAAAAPPDRLVTARMISNYARGSMGNPDPLYTDPEYGKYTRWGGMIAPPTFVSQFGIGVPGLNLPDFPGSTNYHGSTRYDYSTNKVIRPGDEIRIAHKYLGYTEKTEPNMPCRLLFLHGESQCFNQRDEVVVSVDMNARITLTYPGETEKMTEFLFGGRDKLPRYTKDELDMIHQFYDDELAGKTRQGAKIRFWEDVEVGEAIPDTIFGPLQITDLVAAADGGFGTGSVMWASVRQQLDRAIIDPNTGEYQLGVIWHYDDEVSRRLGLPFAHSFALQNEANIAHGLCNWMGDDAWVKRWFIEHRSVRFTGDMAIIKGKVTKKYVEDGEHLVDLDIWLEIQSGFITTAGNATVRLMSRDEERLFQGV